MKNSGSRYFREDAEGRRFAQLDVKFPYKIIGGYGDPERSPSIHVWGRTKAEIAVCAEATVRPVFTVRRKDNSWTYGVAGDKLVTTWIMDAGSVYSVRDFLESAAEVRDPDLVRSILGYDEMGYTRRARYYEEREVERASDSIDSTRGTWGGGYPAWWDTLMKVVYGAKKRGHIAGSRDDNLNVLETNLSRLMFVGDVVVRRPYPVCWTVVPPDRREGKHLRPSVETYEMDPYDGFLRWAVANGLVFFLDEREAALAKASEFGKPEANETVQIHDPDVECADPSGMLMRMVGLELVDLVEADRPETVSAAFRRASAGFRKIVYAEPDTESLSARFADLLAAAPTPEDEEATSLRILGDKILARLRSRQSDFNP